MDSSEEDTEYCNNCKREIPAINFVMHQTHCVRNIILCKKCEEPVPRTEMEAHEEEYHILEPCECGESFEKEQMESHKENGCRLRKVKCEYCEIDLNAEKMSEHKDFCGSRTEKCEKCKKFVKLRDQLSHEHNGCQERLLGQSEKNPYKQPLNYIRGPEQATLWPGNHVVDFFPEDVPFHHEPYYRQTVMEELDSNAMIGQRRSLKNETTQRHNQKNERTVQNLYRSPSDETDGSSPTKQQEQEDYYLAFQLANIEADSVAVQPSQSTSNVSPTDLALFGLAPHSSPPANANFNRAPRNTDTSFSVDDAQEEADLPSDFEIPCEFCNQLISSTRLNTHQEECRLGLGNDLNFHNVVAVDHAPVDTAWRYPIRDEEMFDPYLGTGRQSPPFLDIRQPPSSQSRNPFQTGTNGTTPAIRNDGYRETNLPSDDDDESSMVPCEFCEELFPFDAVSIHQVCCDPQNGYIQDDMKEYGFDSPDSELMRARHKPTSSFVDEIPSEPPSRARRQQEIPYEPPRRAQRHQEIPSEPPSRARKHQPDPVFTDSWVAPKVETKVSVVSKEKTVNMLQTSGQKKLVNKGKKRSTFQQPKIANQSFQHSQRSAFDRPAVGAVSKQKALQMQRGSRLRNVPLNGTIEANSLAQPAQGNGQNTMSALKKAGTSNGRNAGGSDFELSSEVIRNRRGTSSTNKWGDSSARNRLSTHEDDLITSSAKYPNDIDGSNSVMTSEFPPSEVKREKSWEDMREEMNNAASFKSKQTVKSGVGSNSMMTSEPPASEWKREESWEDILENMNNAASFKSKQTVKSGAAQPKYREQNVVTSPSMLKPQRKDGQDQRKKTAQRTSQRTLSSSNLSSRVTPPRSTTAQKSLPFQGSSPSNLKKAVNGTSLEGNSTTAHRRRAVTNLEEPEMAFVRRDLNDVNEFMARNKGGGGGGGTSSSKTNYGRNRQPPSERRQNDGDRVQNLRRHRIVANFDGGEQGIARDNRETRMQRCHNHREANQYN